MTPDFKRIGRIAGILLLAQALIAIPVYTEIGMMSSIISPDFLVQAAGNTAKIRTALVLTFLLAGVTLAVALVVLPVFRPGERAHVLALLWALRRRSGDRCDGERDRPRETRHEHQLPASRKGGHL